MTDTHSAYTNPHVAPAHARIDCGKLWATPSASEICCDTAWLGYD